MIPNDQISILFWRNSESSANLFREFCVSILQLGKPFKKDEISNLSKVIKMLTFTFVNDDVMIMAMIVMMMMMMMIVMIFMYVNEMVMIMVVN